MRGSGLPLLLALAAPLSALAEDRTAAEVDAELLLFLAEFADAEGEVPALGLLDRAQTEAEAGAIEAESPAGPVGETPATDAAAGATSTPPPQPETEATTAERRRGDHR
ncbi:hypothetical protein [Aquimonas voraii]|uniref:Uncharacterized protein n=1 Tax=Aquimonas voraii TaxID=265719 RepID=A0A1G6VFM9_9GAMM|nr:hypothetical protein [Aquimonas voraii]SDD52311.1 hypothetical protein SAMN04488509_10355 [Aquimonas voraii]